MAERVRQAAPSGVPHAAIIGASVSGLAAALALGLRGYTITCIERDATPMPRDHLDAFEKWDWRGAAQTRHSHACCSRRS
jgi:2-polyprenyl-6-methoxyphenol hydroxylase-like FAD-dependent oxidoreductase